jgi:hypothetical protein
MDATAPDTLFCANHPRTPTALRCNKCGKPICPKCAVRTPVGYRCRECVSQQQQVFETARWYDYALAVVLAAPLAGVAGALLLNLSYFVIFLAPVAGGVVAEVVRWAVRRRRGRYLPLAAAGGFALGCLPLFIFPLYITLLARSGAGLFSLIWALAYAVIGASTLFARLRGISIG